MTRPSPPGPVRRAAPAALVAFLIVATFPHGAPAHDIPNQRVDRSIQATLRPGKLELDYEVSLTELTLTQDLRRLTGTRPGVDRSEWLALYGQVTGPLNARGFLIHCDGTPIEPEVRTFALSVEEHPRYTFRFEAKLPERGRLVIQDTNYVSSEGTSRLAVRGLDGVSLEGDDLPGDVQDIPIRPVWQLSDEDEARTKRVEVRFESPERSPVPTEVTQRSPSMPIPEKGNPPVPERGPPGATIVGPSSGLTRLLDRDAGISWLGLLLGAAVLGAAHSIQPGHGKTLVSAVALGSGGRWFHPLLLSLVTTLAHTSSVLLIAAGLWLTGSSQVAGLHRGLTGVAGFAIAAGGFWRIGRALGVPEDHAEGPVAPAKASTGGLIGLGLAGGLVPCWDAVGLVILSAAVGRLATGVLIVLAFGAGMAAVLVAVGLLAFRLKSAFVSTDHSLRWARRLSLVSGLMLAGIGLVFFLA
ncbi:MAG: ABC transporter permease [Isosphaeraceae bacterium]